MARYEWWTVAGTRGLVFLGCFAFSTELAIRCTFWFINHRIIYCRGDTHMHVLLRCHFWHRCHFCTVYQGFLDKLVFASVSVWKACGHKWLAAQSTAVCLFHTATSCLKIFQNANPSLLYSPCPLLQLVPSDSLSGVHIPWRHGQCHQTKQPHTGCKENQDAQTQPNF